MRAQDADVCGKWEIGKSDPAVGKPLFDLKNFDAPHSGLVPVLLGTGEFAAVASGAVFVIDQQTVFGSFLIH